MLGQGRGEAKQERGAVKGDNRKPFRERNEQSNINGTGQRIKVRETPRDCMQRL